MSNPIKYALTVLLPHFTVDQQKVFASRDAMIERHKKELDALTTKCVDIVASYTGRLQFPERAYTGETTPKGNPATAQTGNTIVLPLAGETLGVECGRFGWQVWSEPAGFEGFTYTKAKTAKASKAAIV